MNRKSLKTKLSTATLALAVTAVLLLFIGSSTGIAATTEHGEGAGRYVQITGTNISANISIPAYVGLDDTYWNLSVEVIYLGASADISIIIWINDGASNITAFGLDNETLANETGAGNASFTSSSFAANSSGVIGAALFIDDGGDYALSNATGYYSASISIEEYALIAALNYWIPVIITVAICVAILSTITGAFGKFR